MSPAEPEVSCILSTRAFRLVWTLLVLLYAFITLYLMAHAAMYAVFYVFPITYYYTTTFQLLSAKSYPIVSGAYVATAVLYIQQLFKIVRGSLRRGELRFATPPHATVTGPHVSHHAVGRLRAKARRLYAFLFGTTGLLGVRGPFFGVMTLLRESLEIAIQIVQAYQSSRYTASLWINLTFGGLIITNCFSTPLLHWWFRFSKTYTQCRNVPARRAECRPGVGSGLAPRAAVSLLATSADGAAVLFVTSFGDLVFVKLLPVMSVFFTLKKVQYLVHPKSRRRQSRSQKTARSRASHSVHVSPHAQLVPTEPSSSVLERPRGNRIPRRIDRLLTLVLSATGLFAVAIYVIAYLVYTPQCVSGCLLVLRPWFEVDDAHCFCAVQEINCPSHGIHGSGEEFTRTFESLESRGLLSLIFTHCDALTIPASLLRFRDLYRLELFNCSIVSWSAATALTSSTFPQLGIVSLISTTITEIPAGLLQGDLPPTLREVYIVDSNLSLLLHNLGELWPHVITFYLERGAFTQYPSALSRMPNLESLSLYRNNITIIADDAFDNSTSCTCF